MTGDGLLDIVAGARDADVGGVADVGAIYVWKGGPTLASGDPTFKLTVAGAMTGDTLGLATGQGILLADVTGDGLLDIVAGASGADVSGVQNVGAIYVWKGGPTLATGGPTFKLTVSGATAFDALGSASGQGFHVADVTGDGVLDIIGSAPSADRPAPLAADTGAIYVWRGGATLTTGDPTFRLTVSGAVASDQLGSAGSGALGVAVKLADVTGDGVLDIVAGAADADVSGVLNTGAIYVWKGGVTLASGDPDLALTVAGARTNDRLAFVQGAGQGFQLADVTGDGVLDLVVATPSADLGGPTNSNFGAIYVWKGTLATGDPTFTLTVPGAVTGDQLGN